jgi:uncharacterized protein (TIGR00369 family)
MHDIRPDHANQSGLDILRSMITGTLPGPTMARTMNIRLTEAVRGAVVFHGTPGDDVLNPRGAVHGGWYGALLDSAMGCAVQSVLEAGQVYTTLEYKVNLTRAIPPGTEVEARAQVQHGGRSTAVAIGEIRGISDGRLYATGSTTCIVMSAKP